MEGVEHGKRAEGRQQPMTMLEALNAMKTRREPDLLADFDMTADETWQPMFSPYHGRVVPAWQITQEARMRMGASGEIGEKS
jgi:hypothetical protein